jgi:tetraacyldisaccharide 4'-kinase
VRDGLTRIFNTLWYGHGRGWVVLLPLTWLYRLLFVAHRWMSTPKQRQAGDVPVVVIGNLSVGGTGKTPLVIWLARELLQLGFSVGIISRGYHGSLSSIPQIVSPDSNPRLFGDEPVLLARRVGCPVVVAADRVRAKEFLQTTRQIDLVLSDDGLQHHRLPRCCEIAVVDGARGLGNGACLPAGPLREPPSRLDTVDVVIVNGRGWYRQGAIRVEMKATVVERLSDGETRALEDFAGRSVHAVAGIGNPERFFQLLIDAGIVVDKHPLSDHGLIQAKHLSFPANELVMTTEKDAVKLRDDLPENLWCVRIEVAIEESDRKRLLALVAEKIDDWEA